MVKVLAAILNPELSFPHSVIKAKHSTEQPCIFSKLWGLGAKEVQRMRKFPHVLSITLNIQQGQAEFTACLRQGKHKELSLT